MIFRLYLIIAAALVTFFLYLSSLNHDTVVIRFSGATSLETPLIPLIFIAFISGVAAFYLYSITKNAKRYLSERKVEKDKREADAANDRLLEAKKVLLLDGWTEAEKQLSALIATSFPSIDPYLLLVKGYLETGDSEKAFSVIDALPFEFQHETEVLLYKAKMLLKKGSFDRGIDTLKLLDEKEKAVGIKALLRDAYIEAELWEEANTVQSQIAKGRKKGAPDDDEECQVRIGYELARKKMKEGQEDEAIKKLKELTKKWAGHVQPYVALGKLYWKKGDKKLAETTWIKGYEKTKNLISIFIMEDYYLKDEDPQQIIETYRNLISVNPERGELHFFLGKLYLRLEMLEDALEKLQKAMELEFHTPYLPRLMGEARFRQSDYQPAAEHFKEAIGFKRQTLIPFHCNSCGHDSKDWHYACPHCNGWETLKISL